MKWLDRLRQKSELERKNFALISSFLITLIIFVIWAPSTFFVNVDEIKNLNVANPIESFKDIFKDINKNYE